MNDWLDVMLGEIERKKQEAREALEESERRSPGAPKEAEPDDGSPHPSRQRRGAQSK